MSGFSALGMADAVVAALLFVLLPLLSLAQARHLTAEIISELRRVPAYLSSMAALLAVGATAYWAGTRGPRDASALGLEGFAAGPVAGWTVVLLAAALAAVAGFRALGIVLGVPEHPVMRTLLPRTGWERAVFVALSATAGLAEEIAFRGYGLALALVFVGPVGAVALTSLVFGSLHAYQGVLGVARTAVVGAVLGVGVLLSGSLWPCVVAHAAYDVAAGTVLGERLMVPDAPSGV